MNDLRVFSDTEFGELGVLIIDGREFFPATQCAKLLGYKNPQETIRTRCKGVRKTLTPTDGGTQMTNYIPEGDLYRLIVGSRLPTAERFERWVFDEVLPQIRKNGIYGGSIEDIIAKTATAVAAAVVQQLYGSEIRTAHRIAPKHKEKRKSGYRQPSIIEQLGPELKNHVDGMIQSNRFSCQGIANYLIAHGVQISQVSVNKYAHKYFWDKEYRDEDVRTSGRTTGLLREISCNVGAELKGYSEDSR